MRHWNPLPNRFLRDRIPHRSVAASLLVAAILWPAGATPAGAALSSADVFISDEAFAPNTSAGCTGAALLPPIRTAIDAQDAAWEAAADAAGLTQSWYLQLPVEAAPTTAVSNYGFSAQITGGAGAVVAGSPLTVNVSARDVPFSTVPGYGGAVGDPSTGTVNLDGSGNPSHQTTVNTTKAMQDCAPYPESYWDADATTAGQQSMPFWNDVDNSGTSSQELDGVLFDFPTPVAAFGAWFGDVETRTVARPADDEAPIAVGDTAPTPAYIKLFDAAGNVVYEGVINTATSPQDDTTCGGPVIDTDLVGCGNQGTRWIGFVVPAGSAPVAKMLVTVGDDDSCVEVQDTQCDASTEHLSWIGARVRLPKPTLTIKKTEHLLDGTDVPGDGWTFSASAVSGGVTTPLNTLVTGVDGSATVDLPLTATADLVITETSQTDWLLTGLTCTVPDGVDADADPDPVAVTLDGSTATLTGVLAGSSVTCTAVNTQQEPPTTTTTTSTTTTTTTSTTTTTVPDTTTTTEATTTTVPDTTTTTEATTTTVPDTTTTTEATTTTSTTTTVPDTTTSTSTTTTEPETTTSTSTTEPAPTTVAPTTAAPTTAAPTTAAPTTVAPTTAGPTTAVPTTAVPTTAVPTTAVPTTAVPTTAVPTSVLSAVTFQTTTSTSAPGQLAAVAGVQQTARPAARTGAGGVMALWRIAAVLVLSGWILAATVHKRRRG